MNAPRIEFRRAQWIAFGVGAVVLAASLLGLALDQRQFLRSYLIAHVFWLGVTLGCLALALLHHLAGGRWGAVLQRPLEAGARLLPAAALFGLPLWFGLTALYPWTNPEVLQANPLLQHKAVYLNVPFFLARTALYFAVWIGLMLVATRWSLRLDETLDPRLGSRLRSLSAVGLGLLGLTATFAAMDWLMSLEPGWYSTVYGALVSMGSLLAAFALMIVIVTVLSRRAPFVAVTSPRLWNDLGSLLLAFVMLWLYLAFSQYLIIWSGNIREEVPWYLRRQNGGWQWVALGVIVFNFILPFMVLISRELKRRAVWLAVVAGLVFVMRYVDLFWMVAPAFHPSAFTISWLDLALPAGLGGLWLGAYLRELSRHPLLPQYDVRVQPRPEMEHASAG